jgi:Rod binding domain-containing protein
MTAISSDSATAISPASSASEPAWVRNGSSAVKQDYQEALGFEDVLVQQLSTALSQSTSEGEGSEEEGSSAQGSMLTSLMPEALSEGVMHDGGLGLAAQLTRELEGVQGTGAASSTSSSGAVAAEGATTDASTTGGAVA